MQFTIRRLKMPEIDWPWLVLLTIFQLSLSDRRIKGGQEIISEKRYAVYLLKAPDAPVKVAGWTCGGAIVSRSFVVTAAACVDDLQRIYVIAGYKKFVTSSEIDKDPCTSKMRKRVIFTCIPKEYDLQYERTESWTRIDIALVKVETPFNFTDDSYLTFCSYLPTHIEINYWPKFQEPRTDALAMGWGHLTQYKEDLDVNNYNVDTIKYTPTKIMDKTKCLSHFEKYKRMHPTIQNYMICTLEAGNLDDRGRLILRRPLHLQTGCISEKDKLKGMIGRTCEGKETEIVVERKNLTNDTRQYGEGSYNPTKVFMANVTMDNETLRTLELDMKAKDAPGICQVEPGLDWRRTEADGTGERPIPSRWEATHRFLRHEVTTNEKQNDHGGPLVTWEGGHEILIGVATLYKVDDESNCIGPYLFTSTYCTGSFIRCILSLENDNDTTRRCETSDKKFKIVRRHISWKTKNDRVAHRSKKQHVKKEILRNRPQVPVSAYHEN